MQEKDSSSPVNDPKLVVTNTSLAISEEDNPRSSCPDETLESTTDWYWPGFPTNDPADPSSPHPQMLLRQSTEELREELYLAEQVSKMMASQQLVPVYYPLCGPMVYPPGQDVLVQPTEDLAPKPDVPPASPAPAPEALERCFSIASGVFRFILLIRANKLQEKANVILSEPFHLSFGGVDVPFHLQISAKEMSNGSDHCFQASNGVGTIKVVCLGQIPQHALPVAFRFVVGTGDLAQPPRGPVIHNFAENLTCSLPADLEDWDFKASMDLTNENVSIRVEVVPLAKARAIANSSK